MLILFMACEIYLIKNADAETNRAYRKGVGGRSNFAEITKNGILQAKALGKSLKGIKFNKVYSSPAIRTQQTARYCLEEMGVSPHIIELDSALLELSQGDWEGQPRDEIYGREDFVKGLEKDCWNFVPGDKIKGESQAMVAKRMMDWVKQIKLTKGKILAFASAYSIKYFLADLLDSDKKLAYKIPVKSASVTIIKYEKGKFTCTIQNDLSHLEKAGLLTIK